MTTKPADDEIGWIPAIITYLHYMFSIALGHIYDFGCLLIGKAVTQNRKGYAPLLSGSEDFFQRRLYYHLSDSWNRPISSCPGAWIDVLERKFTWDPKFNKKMLKPTGKVIRAMNLGSYNYLGFADPDSPCVPPVIESLDKYGVGTASYRTDLGTTQVHVELEKLVARFLSKPAAMVFGMGFATNATAVPILVGKGGLIVSDSLNHSSIVTGARSSGAKIKVFKHGDIKSLESVIRRAIIEGQPRTHRPWTKIVILVEGIYSMEGDTCPLHEIIKIKKKYNCYLYVDEAHSIGALGNTGRGVCDHLGVNSDDVDVLMGTFTKSFGAVGGYVAGSQELINYMRVACAGSAYSTSISPPACQQVISSIRIIMGEDGTDLGQRKIRQLKENSNYFRQKLIEMGLHVLGEPDSPVVPVLLLMPSKVSAFSRECLKRGLAVVVVGFPATPLLLARARFCLSAGHTREDLEFALNIISEVSSLCHVRYKSCFYG
eukprot:TRINITY_DN1779_c0_g1_i1.p1 TRINITY_DN1779_c0_g1~~TRINITY_DN1779_c0_g1_i1.p1  ORF type:complete len:488 (-),score=149.17 TRINITY_DN1779_c0_g1_i1:50-1513(-)